MSPLPRRYNLFISHAWDYSDDYRRLVNLLTLAPGFQWSNYSVPKHDPLIDPASYVGRSMLTRKLSDQIRFTHCVLITSGMYATHRRWIEAEIDIAKSFNKPIIGVAPWGQQRTPLIVQSAASEMVRWNTTSIVGAIRRWAI